MINNFIKIDIYILISLKFHFINRLKSDVIMDIFIYFIYVISFDIRIIVIYIILIIFNFTLELIN